MLSQKYESRICQVRAGGQWDWDLNQGSRELDIFLDYLLLQCSDGFVPILNPNYDTVLSAPDRALKDWISHVRMNVPEQATRAPAWRLFEGAFKTLDDSDPAANVNPTPAPNKKRPHPDSFGANCEV